MEFPFVRLRMRLSKDSLECDALYSLLTVAGMVLLAPYFSSGA